MSTPTKKICENCLFFVLALNKKRKPYTWGRCHRYPPNYRTNEFVAVDFDDFCGEFKSKNPIKG